MAEDLPASGMVGPFWVVEDAGRAVAIAVAVPLEQAEAYGDMLTTDTSHYQHWSRLASRGAACLRAEGLPSAPLWSEYEEWPRGRVVFHLPTGRFTLYADKKLQRRPIIGEILRRFSLPADRTDIRSDAHYVSVR